jgi:hypothetical protein
MTGSRGGTICNTNTEVKLAILEEIYRYDVEGVATGHGVCTGHVDSGSITTD